MARKCLHIQRGRAMRVAAQARPNNTSMIDEVRAGLVDAFPEQLVEELLSAYADAKQNFYLGGLRLSAVEGGRFCEAAFRMLQQQCFQAFDPLGRPLDTDR